MSITPAAISSVPSPGVGASPQESPSQASAVDRTKQQAALAKMLRTYQNDLNHGQSASSLKSLAKQIADAAKALGQNVALPTAQTGSGAATAAGGAAANKVNLSA